VLQKLGRAGDHTNVKVEDKKLGGFTIPICGNGYIVIFLLYRCDCSAEHNPKLIAECQTADMAVLMCAYNRLSMLELGSVRFGSPSSDGCRGNVALHIMVGFLV
jgi:hypothetical protein